MNRKDLLTAGGVGLVLAFGWYQFVWQAQGASASKASVEAKAAAESVTKLTRQISTIERTKTELEAKVEQVARIEQAIPDAPELSGLLKQLQATAKSRNVELTSLSNGKLTAVVSAAAPTTASGSAAPTPGTPTSGTPASEMTLTLSLHGTYPAVAAFLNDLSLVPRLVVIESVQLSRNDVQETSGGAVSNADISATISAKVFSTASPLPEGAAANTVAPAASTATTEPKGGL
jgi:Tfp pilus assembly protein PilO